MLLAVSHILNQLLSQLGHSELTPGYLRVIQQVLERERVYAGSRTQGPGCHLSTVNPSWGWTKLCPHRLSLVAVSSEIVCGMDVRLDHSLRYRNIMAKDRLR